MLQIIQKRKIWYFFSGALLAASIIGIVIFGFNYGIDFTGGSLLEVSYSEGHPDINNIKEKLSAFDLGDISVQVSGEDRAIIRMKDIDEETHVNILKALNGQEVKPAEEPADAESADYAAIDTADNDYTAIAETDEGSDNGSGPVVNEERFSSFGPSIGNEMKRKSLYAIFWVIVAIILYVAWAFRSKTKQAQPISSWKYGVIAVIALAHDILITIGVFIVLGRLYGIEINTSFIAALLTILGYSVNDTIVVFDRVRENLPRMGGDFETIVNASVNQTLTRSVNTALTTLLVLVAIYLFGGESIKYFVLALIVGIISGTYSSIFLASPMLVTWERWKKGK